ncbi:hypothetical protein NQ315_000553 [Exocentrus adspersus]|uniref:Adenylate kinase 8 n=1 Tax=Exocentrus adspersus TaxID=1586481 RepID=A0AAV8VAB4_9CUCU|nr:hypothetical protein NQ315_000553 [Exocentrus adspersus]
MSDPAKRPLSFPPWHIPYLEKHRIYELFHEIAREMVIQKPADHVTFMKHILQNAAKSRDVARVILLQSPKINCLEIANEIAGVTKQVVISDGTLMNCLKTNISMCSPKTVARCLAFLVRTEGTYDVGWIMVDCIKTAAVAKELLQLGILPTHVLHLIPSFYPDFKQLMYCNVLYEWPEYRRNVMALRDIFKDLIREIYLDKKNLREIARECVAQSKIRKNIKPIKPRVILIGPRGSGRKTQAKLLAKHLNIVHVDFEALICTIWMSETELGVKLRLCKNEACFHSELLSQIINKRVLEEDCLINGWVLTGFPYTEMDFKYLDTLDTPANRVIFLECDLNICRERIKYRKVNVETGSVTNLKHDPDAVDQKNFKTTSKRRK